MCRAVFLAVLCAAAVPARADIYECVDANGNKRFTNIAAEARGCKVLSVGPPAAAPAAPSPPPLKSQAKAPPGATPSSFPRVDKHVQRERDNDRRRILEQELGQEEKLLAQARRDLSEQQRIRAESSGGQHTADPIERRIKLHEDNVANLRREISKSR